MDIFLRIFIIIMCLCLAIIAICNLLQERNYEVYEFRMEILNESFELYKKLPSYTRMLYSIKPLERKYWL